MTLNVEPISCRPLQKTSQHVALAHHRASVSGNIYFDMNEVLKTRKPHVLLVDRILSFIVSKVFKRKEVQDENSPSI